jgi:hypothetical protein
MKGRNSFIEASPFTDRLYNIWTGKDMMRKERKNGK